MFFNSHKIYGNLIRIRMSDEMACERMSQNISLVTMMTTGMMTTGWRGGRGDVRVMVQSR